MIVCIAEKPSVGRDIARIIGATTSRDGFMEGNGYQVTWTFGHLCGLLDPHEYTPQWKGWNMQSLPMIPQQFGIKVFDDPGVKKQFAIIQDLMQKADMIINCGDAGQEGELIQRWVMQKAGAKCPVKRLWINSMTDEAIREGFQNLKDQSNYQHLYEAGLMRAIGDWLLGMNCTRAYTLKYGDSQLTAVPPAPEAGRKGKTTAPARPARREPLSVGRVQTPTLALIVKRQEEIDHFVPKTYWELKTEYRDTTFNAIIRKSEEDLLGEIQKLQEEQEKKLAKAKDPGKAKDLKPLPTLEELQKDNIGIDPIPSAEEGTRLIEMLKTLPFEVTKVEKKKGFEYAPRLYDLTSLQVECNKKFGFSADKTLQLVQSLYEKKVSTYPRVDTTFLPDDVYPKVGTILKGISSHYPQVARLGELMKEQQAKTGKMPPLPKSKKVFDNSKVTDHHAIIPTGQTPNNITEEERKVFDLIALQFIAAFYPDCQVSTTTVFGQVAGNGLDAIPFKTSGRQVLVAGWREVFESYYAAKKEAAKASTQATTSTSEATDGEDDEAAAEKAQSRVLPDFQVHETGPHKPALLEKQTTPPKPYTEATLLRAMETAGKLVDDDELRDALKENGIGRPSTRAEIIKKLFQRKYIVQKGKSLYPTPIGVNLIGAIQSPLLKSAELTGLWEKKLRMIDTGEMAAKDFYTELKDMTRDVIYEVKVSKVGMLCPVCRQGLIIRGNTAYGCSRWREGCGYREPLPNS